MINHHPFVFNVTGFSTRTIFSSFYYLSYIHKDRIIKFTLNYANLAFEKCLYLCFLLVLSYISTTSNVYILEEMFSNLLSIFLLIFLLIFIDKGILSLVSILQILSRFWLYFS